MIFTCVLLEFLARVASNNRTPMLQRKTM